jgi:hypothetical protein
MSAMRNHRIRMLAKSAALLTLCLAAASAVAGCAGQGAAGRTERSPGAAAEDPSGGSDGTAAEPTVSVSQPPREADGAASDAGGAGGANAMPAAPGVAVDAEPTDPGVAEDVEPTDPGVAEDVEPTAAGNIADVRKPGRTGGFADPPALLGLAIGASEAEARERFGEPADVYRLHDPPVTVLEYDGFTVGVGDDGRVQYIGISGEDMPAGIGDVAVGGAADEAIAAFGEPDQTSDTVLLYRRDGVSLKFDLDPDTKRIASILLYAEP